MCYNKNVSIGTYILGIFGCYNIYINHGYKIEAIFLAWVIQMQLIEYFLWENQSCNTTNIITTKAGVIVNHLEPIVLWIAILLLSTKQLPYWINLFMTVFLIISVIYTIYILDNSNDDKTKCTVVTPKSNPHLEWSWNDFNYSYIYYPLFLISLNILCIYGLENGYNLAILCTVSYILSVLIYKDKKSVGAMWCFAAAFSPWIIPYLYQINFPQIM